MFRYIKKQVYKDGHTGKVAFDNNGDRIYAEYDIVNVKQVANKDAIGKYYFDNVNKNSLINKKYIYIFILVILKNIIYFRTLIR